VLSQEPVYPLTIVTARAIGVMRMRDEKGIDDKIVAVSVNDPAVSGLHRQVAAAVARAAAAETLLRRVQGARAQAGRGRRSARAADAIRIITEALELYRKLRRGETVERAPTLAAGTPGAGLPGRARRRALGGGGFDPIGTAGRTRFFAASSSSGSAASEVAAPAAGRRSAAPRYPCEPG
jgi:hypothetical protein